MIGVYADFNDHTADGGYWILQFDNEPIETKITEVGLSSGDQVLLYQDDDDFEVEATLHYKFVGAIGREGWIAYPNWSTLTRASLERSSAIASQSTTFLKNPAEIRKAIYSLQNSKTLDVAVAFVGADWNEMLSNFQGRLRLISG